MVAERKRPEKKALQQKASEKQVSKKRKAVKQNTSKKKKRSFNVDAIDLILSLTLKAIQSNCMSKIHSIH